MKRQSSRPPRRQAARSHGTYAEVDSDVDMDDEDKQLEQQRSVKYKKPRQGSLESEVTATTNKRPQHKTLCLDTLLGLPVDVFVEITRHLDGIDMINLSKANKRLHTIMLSEASASVWRLIRREYDLVGLDELSDVQCVMLLCNKKCQDCGRQIDTVIDVARKDRRCAKCKRNQTVNSVTCKNKILVAEVGEVHPRLAEVVQPVFIESTRQKRAPWHRRMQGVMWAQKPVHRLYSLTEAAQLNSKLFELEEQDELEQFRLSSIGANKTSTRTRKGRQTTCVQSKAQNLVEDFVNKRKEEIATRDRQRVEFADAVKRKALEEEERKKREEAARWERTKEELELLGWTHDDIGLFKQKSWDDMGCPELGVAPKLLPSQDNEAWAKVAQLIQDYKYRLAKTARREAMNRRWRVLFQQAGMTSRMGYRATPAYYDFVKFNSVVDFMDPKTPLDDQIWTAAIPAVTADLDEWKNKLRCDAARLIVATNKGLSVDKLSQDQNDWPQSEYGNAFFNKATSLFLLYRIPRRAGFMGSIYSLLAGTHTMVTFTELVNENSAGFIATQLSSCRKSTHAKCCRALLKAAKLDPTTATVQDIQALDSSFTAYDSMGTCLYIKKSFGEMMNLFESGQIKAGFSYKAKLVALGSLSSDFNKHIQKMEKTCLDPNVLSDSEESHQYEIDQKSDILNSILDDEEEDEKLVFPIKEKVESDDE
ncbi:hypothetical protein OIO90_006402 [Microbotryomycetes sp. JL221]|nr:hypothetical protein OIO90_006402 [Microbotryomycetes sp. JL221]